MAGAPWAAPISAPERSGKPISAVYQAAVQRAPSRQVAVTVHTPFGALLGAADGPPAAGESCDRQGVCFSYDPFPTGQCTWYAAGRRPDLVGVVHGAAWEWLRAAAGRVPEGRRPAVGAIAVYAPGLPGAPGHLGYVAAISGSRVLLDDSNWRPTPWSPWLQVHEHWEAASTASGYIYGGPAGTSR